MGRASWRIDASRKTTSPGVLFFGEVKMAGKFGTVVLDLDKFLSTFPDQFVNFDKLITFMRTCYVVPDPCPKQSEEEEALTYHDVECVVGKDSYFIKHDYSLELSCTRVGGWCLWRKWQDKSRLIAGEYDEPKLRIKVRGREILSAHKAEEKKT